jgi:hypothetical protein
MLGDKVRENRLRRQAQRHGLRLEKSRQRTPCALGYGGYMLVEVYHNWAICGSYPYAFSATLDDIEAELERRHAA